MKRWPIILSGLYVYLEMFVVLFPFIISNVANIDAVKKYVPKFFIDFGAWIMINWLFVAIALFVVPSVICVIIFIVFLILSFRNNNNMTPEYSLRLMKTQLIMRLVQIPGYIMIFVASVAFLLTIFTAAFTVVFILVDIISITITGLLSVSVYYCLYRKGLLNSGCLVLFSVLSFIYCLDVIVSIVGYVIAKNNKIRFMNNR